MAKTWYAVIQIRSGEILYCGTREKKCAEHWAPGSFWGAGPDKASAILDVRMRLLRRSNERTREENTGGFDGTSFAVKTTGTDGVRD